MGDTAEDRPPGAPPTTAALRAQLRAEQKKLALVQEIGHALSSALDLDGLLALIMEKITILMEADRSTLYLLSDDGKELWSKVAQGSGEVLEIRLNVGEGIAGWVGMSGETVNIPDAYSDRRFYPAVDLRSGYRTRSILCMPMDARGGRRIGVIQVLNKADGPFTTEDEALLHALASQAAVAIENQKLYHSVVAKNVELARATASLEQKTRELDILFTIEREVNEAQNLSEILDRLLRRAMQVFEARAGSILLRERGTPELTFRSTAGEKGDEVKRLRVRLPEGIAGWVAANEEPIIANDPAADERHDRRLAESIGYLPKNLICVPLIGKTVEGDEDEVLGVIELLDKDDPRGFNDDDLKLLGLIAGQASRAIQLARSKEGREHQNRLASIGQMMASVLHDLKTPMTIVSGYAQLMAQIDEAEQRASYVEQILKQFDNMSAMTKEVLAFARGEANVLIRRAYVHKFLAEIQRHLEHELAGKEIRLVMDAGYRGAAYFDEQKILRLVHNIARNAVQAMPGGGTLRIATSQKEGRLVFEFADTGGGIPIEMEGRLFELFATSGKKDGTGLGLAIVKKIVDEHRGHISYVSRRGGPGESGTTFTIALPLEKPAAARSGPDPDDDDDDGHGDAGDGVDPAAAAGVGAADPA
jgi:signal transduction histidine kinase